MVRKPTPARLEVIKVREYMEDDQGLDKSVNLKYHFEEKMLGILTNLQIML